MTKWTDLYISDHPLEPDPPTATPRCYWVEEAGLRCGSGRCGYCRARKGWRTMKALELIVPVTFRAGFKVPGVAGANAAPGHRRAARAILKECGAAGAYVIDRASGGTLVCKIVGRGTAPTEEQMKDAIGMSTLSNGYMRVAIDYVGGTVTSREAAEFVTTRFVAATRAKTNAEQDRQLALHDELNAKLLEVTPGFWQLWDGRALRSADQARAAAREYGQTGRVLLDVRGRVILTTAQPNPFRRR